MNFYISDHHFDHTNIIRLAKRPFITVNEMERSHSYMPLDRRARVFDVCVESSDYTPKTAEQIIMKGNKTS